MGRPRELTQAESPHPLANGYPPVEVWLPDRDDPTVLAAAQAEARRIAAADQEEGILDWLEAVQKDMWEGEDQV